MSKKILNKREKTHGDYKAVAAVAQSIKTALHLGKNHLPYIAQESLELIATKMARIVCGDWRKKDHWDDIAGYALLISRELKDE